MKKKVIICILILIVLSGIAALILRTVVFPESHNLKVIKFYTGEEDNYDYIIERSSNEDSSNDVMLNLENFGGEFPSTDNNDYIRVILEFENISHSFIDLYDPQYMVSNIDNDCERIVFCVVGSTIDETFSPDSHISVPIYFYVGGMKEDEIKDYIINSIPKLKFELSYYQKYIGLRKTTFSVSKKEAKKPTKKAKTK